MKLNLTNYTVLADLADRTPMQCHRLFNWHHTVLCPSVHPSVRLSVTRFCPISPNPISSNPDSNPIWHHTVLCPSVHPSVRLSVTRFCPISPNPISSNPDSNPIPNPEHTVTLKLTVNIRRNGRTPCDTAHCD